MSQNQTIIAAISQALVSRRNCSVSGNKGWMQKWDTRINQLEQELPSGSGFDRGTDVVADVRTPEFEIKLSTQFHHMNGVGMYDGWTDHVVTVRPTFDGLDFSVSGQNKREIKDYIVQHFSYALQLQAPEVPWATEKSS